MLTESLSQDNKNNLDFAESFEEELRKSYHYNLARNLNQLCPLELKPVKNLITKVQIFFSEYKQIKMGDLKNFCLITDFDLAKKLLATLREEISQDV